jgi:hypothetical protein
MKNETKEELQRIEPLTSHFPHSDLDLDLDFFVQKFKIKVHTHCKTVYCAFVYHYILLGIEFKSRTNEFITSHDLIFNITVANEHDPRAEMKSRRIKVRVRSSFHHLPFTKLPRPYSCHGKHKETQLFSSKRRYFKVFHSRIIVIKEVLDYEKYCKIPFQNLRSST